LTDAQIIQFAPYLAQKQKQEVERARLMRPSPPADCGDIRAWVAAMIAWDRVRANTSLTILS